ncbi:MAG: hypothetical protein JO204_12765 [Alphaproteobacteria bacterium]|nr:hypothetical protein [Alphaproteobacteria bacterium]
MRFSAKSLAILGLLLPAISPALAQQEPPARVGRVAIVNAELGFHGQGETAWSKASVNYPAASGESFWADPKSRAELRVGSRSIGMNGNTEVDVTKLDQQVMQLGLPHGRLDLHVRTLLEGESIEIDLPRGAVWILQPGIYDVDSGEGDRPERIAVFEGSARFVGGSLDVAVKSGDAAVISGTQTLTSSVEKAATDDFTKWCRSNDFDEHRLAAPYHVSPQMTGYEALDEYGNWRTVANYGTVWYPRSVPMGWIPYRDGYWSWVEPWGWNWIDVEPWGFAPFHYGRWAYIDGLWGWVPGDFESYPVYAPALVAFVSDPAAIVTAAVAEGLAGWFPLGPGEPYWPWYTNDPSYIAAVNTGIVADPRNLGARPAGDPASAGLHYANRRFATVVSQQTFASAQPIGRSALPIRDPAAQHARVTAQAPGRPAGAVSTARGAGHAAAAAAVGPGAGAGARGGAQGGRAAVAGRGAAATPGTGPRFAGGESRFAGPRMAQAHVATVAAPRFARAAPHIARTAAPRFAAPRMARMAAPHFAAPRMAAPHFAAPRGPIGHIGGGMGPHGGGGPAFHLGGGGGGPHGGGGGAPHGGGGGGPHGGGGGGPHGGGGGKGH